MKKKFFIMLAFLAMILAFSISTAHADYYTDGILLYEGKSGTEVTNLQKDLKSLGYFIGEPNGYFGSYTEQTVIKFQKDNYLSQDGVVGRKTAREIKVDRISQTAKTYIGVPYLWGGSSPSGFDCSGFTQYVMQKNNIALSRTTAVQYTEGTWVNKANLQQGDLVFFSTYKPGPSHVGIYLGNNKFIHASSSMGISITDLSNSYFAPRYIGAKRILA
ncbi:MAG TPA: NlpC/P60 family protein [Pseudobacteroides sp.]|uniref:C40 family peptidase n=1 Tax=Pseudobacteroides sp. TaxID=1968840 RepID=UPI002F931222